jgi:hypothetical protein
MGFKNARKSMHLLSFSLFFSILLLSSPLFNPAFPFFLILLLSSPLFNAAFPFFFISSLFKSLSGVTNNFNYINIAMWCRKNEVMWHSVMPIWRAFCERISNSGHKKSARFPFPTTNKAYDFLFWNGAHFLSNACNAYSTLKCWD